MPASPIRKLVPYAEAAKKRGTKVYHLNIGQPDIETPPQILDAVKNSDFKILEYSHSAGNETYRKKLGKASVTGYCIRFKTLKDINTDVLSAAIRYGFENRNEKDG